MDCKTAREGLWPPERPRLAGDDVVEAREHVSECPECRDYFQQDRILLELYDRIRDREAPPELRSRIFDVLARERTAAGRERGAAGEPPGERAGTRDASRSRWIRRGALGAATAAVVAAAMVWTAGPEPVPTERSLYVEDYLRRAVSQDRIETSDPAEVARFLERELGLGLTPLRLDGVRLAGAEICLLEGRRGAMILYRDDGATLSHYVVPSRGARPQRPSPGAGLEPGSSGGVAPAVVTWASPSLQHALVGPMSTDRLLALARDATSE